MRFVFLLVLMVFLGNLAWAAEGVPIRMRKGFIFVEGEIQGKSCSFLLDTGAEETVLSERLAKDLGLGVIGRERVHLTRGIATADRSEAFILRIGSSALKSRGALCLNLRKESRQLGECIDGLIGMDFLEGKVVRADFARGRLEFQSRATVSGGATVVPITMNFGAPCVEVTVGNRQLGKVRVDTGCDQTLCWVDTGMWGIRFGSYRKRSEFLTLGSMQFGKVGTRCYNEAIFPNEDGLLGMKLLAGFRTVTFDFSQDRLVLER